MRFWVFFPLMLPLAAQTFEVASIRLHEGPGTRSTTCHNMKTGTEEILYAGTYLNLLVIDAYEMDADRFDLPDSGRNPQFEVKAKLPPNTDADGCRKMLKTLLAERFHLVTAVEIQQLPTYFLKVAKAGLKLKPAAATSDPRGGVASKTENGIRRLTFQGSPIARIANMVEAGVVTGSMAGVLESDRLVDETGLTGAYDGDLSYQHTTQAGQLSGAPSLKDALQDQLGLTLELRKAPRRVLVRRSADRVPTEN